MAPLPSSDLSEQKRALRREMSAARTALPESECSARSEAACARLLALPELAALCGAGPKSLAGYVAAPGENGPAPVLAAVSARGGGGRRRRGARGGWPRGASEPPRLRFHRAAAGPRPPGRFGLREPAATAP